MEGKHDGISWNLMAIGQYSAALAYKAESFGVIPSDMKRMVWKIWAPPESKHFSWLALQNRLWTADRLEKRGWPNCGLCPLGKRTTESVDHLFVHCHFTMRIWGFSRIGSGSPLANPFSQRVVAPYDRFILAQPQSN